MYFDEKKSEDIVLPTSEIPVSQSLKKSQKNYRSKVFALVILLTYIAYLLKGSLFNDNQNTSGIFSYSSGNLSVAPETLCPIAPKLVPEDFEAIKPTIDTILHDKEFRYASAEKLSKAVQIPTEVTDETKFLPITDDYFKPFAQFHDYLAKTFPKIHTTLEKETANTFGLIYTWKGSNPNLKPLLLTAHQDVVPVEWATADKWDHPPYEGYFDGDIIWGRGSSDCKNLLVGLMETVELLISEGYEPTRTVILAFGFDEEASGVIGASHIAEKLYEKYGDDSIYALIDEGNSGVAQKGDQFFASLATGEKGYLDSSITLKTPGGHSSVPPDHTAIGIMAKLINLVEKSPFHPSLPDYNPFLKLMQCYAAYSEDIDVSLKDIILNSSADKHAEKALIHYLYKELSTRYLISTSQAIDIINGGIKSNALPESVSVIINSRINIDSTVAKTHSKILGNVFAIANRFDLGVISNDVVLRPITPNGYFNYTDNTPLEVAPITEPSGPFWDLFTGSLRHFYEDVAFVDELDGKPVIPTPGLSTGNTDTRYYWNLTKNIFRYSPGSLLKTNSDDESVMGNIHSVNEFAKFDGHLNIIAFFYEFIRNVDTYGSD